MAVSAGLVTVGYLVGVHDDAHLGYDSNFYVAMATGDAATVPGPFRFRVLIPFLVSLLPVSAVSGLRIVSYLSLFGFYLFTMRAADRIGLGLRDSLFGLLAVWGSTWHLFHYFNPYMTDPFALLALGVMVDALLRDAFVPFAIAAIVGTLGRETTALLAPAWVVTRDMTRAGLLIAAIGVAIVLPRYLLGADRDLSIASAFNSSGTLFNPGVFARQVATTWGAVWFLAIAGVWLAPRPHRARLVAIFAMLFAGALVASAVATDTGRMFAFLAPILALGAAQFYALARRHTPGLAWILFAAIAVQGVFNTPMAMFDQNAWVVGWPRRTFVLTELALGILILWKVSGNPKGLPPQIRTRAES